MSANSKGLTLIEVLVVVIIVAILASMALPVFSRAFELARAKEAVASLRQIRTGERIYRISQDYYFPYSGTETDSAQINNFLNIYLDASRGGDWNYSIVAPTSNIFEATATRRGGAPGYRGRRFKINQKGELQNIDWPLWPLFKE